jgi:hypothetical protein
LKGDTGLRGGGGGGFGRGGRRIGSGQNQWTGRSFRRIRRGRSGLGLGLEGAGGDGRRPAEPKECQGTQSRKNPEPEVSPTM